VTLCFLYTVDLAVLAFVSLPEMTTLKRRPTNLLRITTNSVIGLASIVVIHENERRRGLCIHHEIRC